MPARPRPASRSQSNGTATASNESLAVRRRDLVRSAGRSMRTLRLACLGQTGRRVSFSTPTVAKTSRVLGRRVVRELGMGPKEILALLEREGLGQS
jgi:hypothetical protein